MKKITTLLLAILLVLPAMAANIPAGTKLYLTPNSNWKQSNARYAAYFFGNGDAWVSMTKVSGETDLYEVTSPNKNYTNVIFCRMNPSASANNWNNKWNQTADLTYDGTNNHYTVKAGTWDKGGGTWSYYGQSVEVMVGLKYTPEKILDGDEVTFTASVVNAEGQYSVKYYVDNNALESDKWIATTGTHTAYAEVTHSAGTTQSEKVSFTVSAITSQFTVYLEKVGAWSDTYIYYWGDQGNSWPGDAMNTTTENGIEYFYYTFRNVNTVNIIFTDGGSNQTVDITNVTKTTYYRIDKKGSDGKYSVIVNPTTEPEPEIPVVYNVTVPAGTPACYIAGEMNDWGFTAMTQVDETHYTITFDNATRSTKYKYTCGADWAYVEVQADGNDISDRTWSENDVVAAWKATPAVPTLYAETIVKGDYYLNPGPWEVDEAWYAVYLFNKNNNPVTYTWVEGWLTNHMVIFGYTGEEAYTHMIFCRMNPAYNEMTWGDETTVRVWNQTEDIAYGTDKGAWSICNITGWEANNYEWGVIENPTALDRVETTNGITYAYGVVSAEGAIEVYNINGVVVARGNDNIDLRGLNGGVYIVRNGNQVRKVVR